MLAYREEYLVERGFGRLKGKPLHRHITPLSQLQKHIFSLWNLSPHLYDQLGALFLEPA